MTLECITAFGDFRPGDYVTVPDNTEVFDRQHFRVVAQADSPTDNEGGE